jgi:hypothetical protein
VTAPSAKSMSDLSSIPAHRPRWRASGPTTCGRFNRNHVPKLSPPSIPEGKASALHFRRMSSDERFALLRLEPLTGRMHQIRVQAASRRWPIAGDIQYGAVTPFGPPVELSRDRIIALHGWQLTFRHPILRTCNDSSPASIHLGIGARFLSNKPTPARLKDMNAPAHARPLASACGRFSRTFAKHPTIQACVSFWPIGWRIKITQRTLPVPNSSVFNAVRNWQSLTVADNAAKWN